jgi:gliding motility-associated-like protein
LTSCVWYTLTLVISDVNDPEYDSAVFLEAGSLSSNAPSFTPGSLTTINGSPVFTEGVTNMNENCGNMVLKLSVGNEPLAAPITFPLTIGGTATPGVDYQALPSSVTIPAGSYETSIPITVISDAISEGSETINITYIKPTCSGPVSVTQMFTILDPAPPISITTSGPFTYTCPRITTSLNATISGGRPPYQFQWVGFDAQENPVEAIPEQTTTYTFNLTDACGTTEIATSQVNIPGFLPLTISTPTSYIICKGDKVLIGSAATGGKAPVTHSWSPITELSPVVLVQPEETTVYTLTATDACNIDVSKDITVKVNEVVALFDVTYLDQRVVQFNDLSYNDVQNWTWDFDYPGAFSSEQNPLVTFPDTGWYSVELEVTDANNCRDIVSNPIYAYPPYSLFIPNAFTPDGDGINDVFSALGEGYADYEMWIFNRWGEQIYYTDSDSKGWGSRGRYSLEDLQSGVYAYRIVTRRPTLEKNEYLGKIVVFE